ncbi:MAG: hypothetical protein IK017_12730 [Paludibacteraceae bacterium]|nr:hypothetical protein [Paludibacteraceae bacterium]
MATTSIKYQWALNEDGKVIFIENISEDNRRQNNFYCPNCNCLMIPVLGMKRQHHFRHDGKDHCSYESYLHNLSKKRFKEAFDERDEFLIEVNSINACDQFDVCLLRKNGIIACRKSQKKVLNLKEFYDSCAVEKEYNGFIADVMLYDSTGMFKVPTFLEVNVSHPCDEKKIQSDIPIIEFKIKNEEDLNQLLRETVIKEYNSIFEERRMFEDRVIFYNLNNFEDEKPYENLYSGTTSLNHQIDVNGYFVKENKYEIEKVKVVCHDLFTGKKELPSNVQALLVLTKGPSLPHLIKDIDRLYAERCMLALSGKLKLCCEHCKYGERKVRNNRFYSFYSESEYLNCKKNRKIKYQIKNIGGQIIVREGEMNRFSYDTIMNYKCDQFELDEEKLKEIIEYYGCVGWIRNI